MSGEANDVQEQIDALHAQIASVQTDIGGRVDRLTDRFERVERALLGDDDVGLTGMVSRVNRLDDADKQAAQAHVDIEERRRDGDKRLHERVDKLEKQWNRAVWLAIGMSIGSATGAATLTHYLAG